MSETSGLQVKSNNMQIQVQVWCAPSWTASFLLMQDEVSLWSINGHTVVLGLTHVFSGWALTYCEKAAKSWLRESNHAPAAQQTPPRPSPLLRPTWELPRWNFVTLPDQDKNDIHVALVCNPALLPWRYKQKCSSCCLRGSISPTIHPSLCQKISRKTEREGSGIDHSASAKRIMVYNCHTEL